MCVSDALWDCVGDVLCVPVALGVGKEEDEIVWLCVTEAVCVSEGVVLGVIVALGV